MKKRKFDVIVIGTGMGGSAIGWALAKAGRKVLFLEKGCSLLHDEEGLRGNWAETYFNAHPPKSETRVLTEAGRATEKLTIRSGRARVKIVPFLGAGTGGSTSLYGGVMERFRPEDFKPGQYFSTQDASTSPAKWPISYEELEPYYIEAEKHLHAKSIPTESPAGKELRDFLVRKELKPYALKVAVRDPALCHGCQGYLCQHGNKMDAGTAFLKPALMHHGADLFTYCRVTKLAADKSRITGVHVIHHGVPEILEGEMIILAAGALDTPRILLQSASEQWPNGLANQSRMVGRNLMRHFVDLYVVFTKNKPDYRKNPKELGLDQFYTLNNMKLGTLQSFGFLPSKETLFNEVKESHPVLYRFIAPVLHFVVKHFLSRGIVLASILEDAPRSSNFLRLRRSEKDSHRMEIEINYNIMPSDQTRIQFVRKLVKKILSPYRFVRLSQANDNRRLGHVCGTCRFGENPETSVLDRNNKAHDLDNLYVVDASFLPTSGGTNPSLTIAANALRVADQITVKTAQRAYAEV